MNRYLPAIVVILFSFHSAFAAAQDESIAHVEATPGVPFSFIFVVHDDAGDFVSNLVKEDFRLLIDGQPAEIISLKESRPIYPDNPDVVGYLTSLRERKRDGLTPPEPPILPRNIVFAFDSPGLSAAGAEHAVELAGEIFDHIALPWDRVYLYQLDESPIRISGPVSDSEEFKDALSRVSHLGFKNISDQTRNEFAGLDELIQRTAALEGRTAIVLFSENFEHMGEENDDAGLTQADDVDIHQGQEFSLENQLYSDVSSYELLRGLGHCLFAVDCSSETNSLPGYELADVSVGGSVFSAEESESLVNYLGDSLGSYYRLECRAKEEFNDIEMDVSLSFSVQLPFSIQYPNKHFAGLFVEPEPVTEEITPFIRTENYLVSAGRDLPTSIRLLQVPFARQWGALALIKINAHELLHSSEKPFELERIISIEDGEGQLIFHSHKHYLADADEKLPEAIWLLEALPLADTDNRIRILVRDVNEGLLFLRSMSPKKLLDTEVKIGEPFLLHEAPPGNADSWRSAAIDDGIDAEIPRGFSPPLPPGIPAQREVINQGEFVTLYVLLDWENESITSDSVDIAVNYLLLGTAGEYLLRARNQRILPLPGKSSIALIAEVPLGMAQETHGVLQIEVKGLMPGVVSTAYMSFSINEFDSDRAKQLLESDNIRELSATDDATTKQNDK